jgi:hypothetical protein
LDCTLDDETLHFILELLAQHTSLRVLRIRMSGWWTLSGVREILNSAPALTCLEVAVLGSLRELSSGLAQLLRGPLRLVRLGVAERCEPRYGITSTIADGEESYRVLLRALEGVESLKELYIGDIARLAESSQVVVMDHVIRVANICGLTLLNVGMSGGGGAMLGRTPDKLLATALGSNKTLKHLRLEYPCTDKVWLRAVRRCTSLESFEAAAEVAAWVVKTRRPGPEPCPGSFLASCSLNLRPAGTSKRAIPVKVKTECWLVRCSAPGCRKTVCTRHGHGDGWYTGSGPPAFLLRRCVAEDCHRQFCKEHAKRPWLRDCDVCANGARAEASLAGLDLVGGQAGEHGRCKMHAPVRCTPVKDCGFYCCPSCFHVHRCGDNPMDYI